MEGPSLKELRILKDVELIKLVIEWGKEGKRDGLASFQLSGLGN